MSTILPSYQMHQFVVNRSAEDLLRESSAPDYNEQDLDTQHEVREQHEQQDDHIGEMALSHSMQSSIWNNLHEAVYLTQSRVSTRVEIFDHKRPRYTRDSIEGHIIISNNSEKNIPFEIFFVSFEGDMYVKQSPFQTSMVNKKFLKVVDFEASGALATCKPRKNNKCRKQSTGKRQSNYKKEPENLKEAPAGIPCNKILVAQTTYKIPFYFKVPDWQVLEQCCGSSLDSHLELPPSSGRQFISSRHISTSHSQSPVEDLNRDWYSVSYTVNARLFELQAGEFPPKAVIRSHAQEHVRVIPRHVPSQDDFKLNPERQIVAFSEHAQKRLDYLTKSTLSSDSIPPKERGEKQSYNSATQDSEFELKVCPSCMKMPHLIEARDHNHLKKHKVKLKRPSVSTWDVWDVWDVLERCTTVDYYFSKREGSTSVFSRGFWRSRTSQTSIASISDSDSLSSTSSTDLSAFPKLSASARDLTVSKTDTGWHIGLHLDLSLTSLLGTLEDLKPKSHNMYSLSLYCLDVSSANAIPTEISALWFPHPTVSTDVDPTLRQYFKCMSNRYDSLVKLGKREDKFLANSLTSLAELHTEMKQVDAGILKYTVSSFKTPWAYRCLSMSPSERHQWVKSVQIQFELINDQVVSPSSKKMINLLPTFQSCVASRLYFVRVWLTPFETDQIQYYKEFDRGFEPCDASWIDVPIDLRY